jgi:hypothetical protein
MRLLNRFGVALLITGLLFSLSACGNNEEAKTESEATEQPESESVQQDTTRGKTSAMFGEASVSIEYGRPKLDGRDMIGQATEGMVWRMGMNESTTITTDADLHFGETVISAGEYSLWMKKVSGDNWELLFNEKTGIWGRPSPEEGYIASVPMMMSSGEESVEQFTIEVSANDETTGTITAMWGTAILKCDFTVGG